MHYENIPTQYTVIFKVVKSFLICSYFFAQNIDCGYKLEPSRRVEAVLTSTQNQCFGAKIRKIGIPLHTPVLLYYHF